MIFDFAGDEIYEYVKTEFDGLSLGEKIKYYNRVFYPHRGDRELNNDEIIDIVFKMPDSIYMLSTVLSYKQEVMIDMMSRGYSNKEIKESMGYKHRSSVNSALNSIRKKIFRLLDNL